MAFKILEESMESLKQMPPKSASNSSYDKFRDYIFGNLNDER
jgi:hypothetical protein